MFYDLRDYIRTKYYCELKDMPAYIRQAAYFKYMTEEMPLSVKDGDFIAGWHGFEDENAPLTSETKRFEQTAVLTDEEQVLKEHLRDDLKTVIAFTKAHTCVDYEAVVQKGLLPYAVAIEEELSRFPDDECLLAMKLSLEAVFAYTERFAKVVLEKMSSAAGEEKERLGGIYTALCRVPKQGARNFLEAVQAIWILHSLLPMAEMSWASISLGRIDQYLYPFYKKYVDEGGTKDEAKAILKNLILLLDSYGDGACAMNIGGEDAEGNCLINELSEVLIEVEKEMQLRSPIFTLRVSPSTPDSVLDELINFELFKVGQPTFYGELVCREAMVKRGVPYSEAVGFSTNSCMGLIVPGKEFSDMWGIKFNSHLPLELAVNGGKPLNSDINIPLTTKAEEISDFEGLVDKYGEYFAEILSVCARLYEGTAKEAETNIPGPLLSALTDGCIKNRRDRATGATYNTVTVETMGLVNACDALFAIKELIFEQNKYSLEEFIDAAKKNYEGYSELLSDISKCKKYGTGDEEYDALCRKVCHKVAISCKNLYHDNRMYLPSLHTLTANVNYGLTLYATLDGRLAGTPINKNANPSYLLGSTVHTSVIRSAAGFDQTEFSGGQPIDLYFDKSWFETKKMRDKIKALITTYFRLGGMQLQVNSADIPLFEKAHAEPEKYPFVIVRCGGYSMRFCEMTEKQRAEFIERAKNS